MRKVLWAILVLILAACSNPSTPDQLIDSVSTTGRSALLDAYPEGWTKIEPGGDTRCSHDTPYAFWVKPGENNKLLVYMRGGGWCEDAASCSVADTITDGDDPSARVGGIFSETNDKNPFRDHTMVWIPLCTYDTHWGDNVETYERENGSTLEIYHRGFVNASAALAWAYENVPDPDAVFVTGFSSGSIGSSAHIPYVIEQYPNAQVIWVGDSGNLVIDPPIEMQTHHRVHDNFPDWIPALQALVPGNLFPTEYLTALANYYPDHTFAEINSAFDEVQTDNYSISETSQLEFGRELQSYTEYLVENTENYRYYMTAGDRHGFLIFATLFSHETEGVKLIDWITAIANGEDVENVQCQDCKAGSSLEE